MKLLNSSLFRQTLQGPFSPPSFCQTSVFLVLVYRVRTSSSDKCCFSSHAVLAVGLQGCQYLHLLCRKSRVAEDMLFKRREGRLCTHRILTGILLSWSLPSQVIRLHCPRSSSNNYRRTCVMMNRESDLYFLTDDAFSLRCQYIGGWLDSY